MLETKRCQDYSKQIREMVREKYGETVSEEVINKILIFFWRNVIYEAKKPEVIVNIKDAFRMEKNCKRKGFIYKYGINKTLKKKINPGV